MNNIQPKDFGKDHWSLLAYVETRCVDYEGFLDKKHLRIKNQAVGNGNIFGIVEWEPKWGTRLSGFFRDGKDNDMNRQLPDHDDLDCLEDLEHAGYIKNIGTGFTPIYEMTKTGNAIASLLRQHKQDGKHYATFSIQ
ncbi:MAG: hypothetical protein WC414_04305 [Patescibacteria group bacterium]